MTYSFAQLLCQTYLLKNAIGNYSESPYLVNYVYITVIGPSDYVSGNGIEQEILKTHKGIYGYAVLLEHEPTDVVLHERGVCGMCRKHDWPSVEEFSCRMFISHFFTFCWEKLQSNNLLAVDVRSSGFPAPSDSILGFISLSCSFDPLLAEFQALDEDDAYHKEPSDQHDPQGKEAFIPQDSDSGRDGPSPQENGHCYGE